MTHGECKFYIELDCEKGMCGRTKMFVPLDGEGSQACPAFMAMEKCGNCKNFCDLDKYGVGTCRGFEKENWAYATCGGSCCPNYQG